MHFWTQKRINFEKMGHHWKMTKFCPQAPVIFFSDTHVGFVENSIFPPRNRSKSISKHFNRQTGCDFATRQSGTGAVSWVKITLRWRSRVELEKSEASSNAVADPSLNFLRGPAYGSNFIKSSNFNLRFVIIRIKTTTPFFLDVF